MVVKLSKDPHHQYLTLSRVVEGVPMDEAILVDWLSEEINTTDHLSIIADWINTEGIQREVVEACLRVFDKAQHDETEKPKPGARIAKGTGRGESV